jgi:hypothetical protein
VTIDARQSCANSAIFSDVWGAAALTVLDIALGTVSAVRGLCRRQAKTDQGAAPEN